MKLKKSMIWSLLGLILLCGNVCFAQKKESLRSDWLAYDRVMIERYLPQLKQNESLTLETIEKMFAWPATDRELGFGGRTFSFSKSGYYTYLRVDGFIFNHSVGYYTISVQCNKSWPLVKTAIIDAWKRTSELDFKEGQCGLLHRREFTNVVADYKNAIATRLGGMADVTVPPHLKVHYELLVSMENNSVIGSGGCDYSGYTPLGKEAIDAIMKAGRVDLIGNVLKGHNPGGRVYAALALIEMQRKGAQLPADVLPALDVVRNLDLLLETCLGCIHFSKTAKRIIDEWPF